MTDFPAWLRHATVWSLLALGIFLGVQTWQARARESKVTVTGDAIELRRAADGHYHWPGAIDGQAVDFLVDTGASTTAIPGALARQLRLPEVGRQRSMTAGGAVIAPVVLADIVLRGGVHAERLRVGALPDLNAPLLGMDILGRLRLQQSQGVLRVEMGDSR
jgi:aspartyl protease family protein